MRLLAKANLTGDEVFLGKLSETLRGKLTSDDAEGMTLTTTDGEVIPLGGPDDEEAEGYG